MYRLIEKKLKEWKESPIRKPLILQGVRQVGKTYSLKAFGEKYYKDVLYLNFYNNKELCNLFENTNDVERLIKQLSIVYNQNIHEENTLIIFDEIQECSDALNCLKFINENANRYHIACAGSYLGIEMHKGKSFPVGKVDFLTLNPLTFTEFIVAHKRDNLIEYISKIEKIERIPDIIVNQLIELYKEYLITGGMPEVVSTYLSLNDISVIDKLQDGIITSYRSDFSKHAESSMIKKINLVYDKIPSQLAKENNKFLYSALKSGARAREYEDAIIWLNDARMIYKINQINNVGFPLSSYEDLSCFKLYLSDVGLLRKLSNLTIESMNNDKLFVEFKGILTENYVLESLINLYEGKIYYWSRLNPSYSVDYIIENKNEIIPVEVKSASNIKAKSLKYYKEKYNEKCKLSIRYSLENLEYNNGILNIPLYLIDNTEKLIEICGNG